MLDIGCPIDHGGYEMCWQAEQKTRLTTTLYDITDYLYFPIGIMICYEDLATFQQHLYLEYNLQVDTVFWNLCIPSGFRYTGLLLINKLVNKWFLVVMWLLSTFDGHHNDLVNCYGISVSHMSTDMSYPSFL